MTTPHEFRMVLIITYLSLTMLGIGYNKLITQSQNWKWADGLTSFSVAIGCSFTLGALWLAFRLFPLPLIPSFGFVITIVFGGFACSGAPMMIGQRMRFEQISQEEARARKGHRPLMWPHDMREIRDLAGEEAMSGYRTLGLVTSLNIESEAKVAKARANFIKIAALLVRAGAPLRIERL